jgi:hypothetical protein
LPAALAQHQCDVLFEIDVGDPQPGGLRQAHAGVEEQPDDGSVTAILERAALAGGE